MLWWYFWMTVAAAPTPCGQDGLEPNDARARARRIEVGVPVEAAACAGDEDWYVVALERGAVLEVRVRHHATARFQPPEVYPPRARKARGSPQRGKEVASARYPVRRAGLHRIRVRSPEATRAAYSLVVEVRASTARAAGPPKRPR